MLLPAAATHPAAQAEGAPGQHRDNRQGSGQHDEPEQALLPVLAVALRDRALVLQGALDREHRGQRAVSDRGTGVGGALVLPEGDLRVVVPCGAMTRRRIGEAPTTSCWL